jgi:hypothetical protein
MGKMQPFGNMRRCTRYSGNPLDVCMYLCMGIYMHICLYIYIYICWLKERVDFVHFTVHRTPKWNLRTPSRNRLLRAISCLAWTITGIITGTITGIIAGINADYWAAESTVRVPKSVSVGCPSPWRNQDQIALKYCQTSFTVRLDSKSHVRSHSMIHRVISNDI